MGYSANKIQMIERERYCRKAGSIAAPIEQFQNKVNQTNPVEML